MAEIKTEVDMDEPADDAPESEWRKYAREWEKAAKANAKVNGVSLPPEELKVLRDKAASHDDLAEKAKKYDELVSANKSEVERERDRAEKAEKALKERDEADTKAKAEADAVEAAKKLRDEVAAAKKLAPGLLRGSTKEELEAHADELIKAGVKPAAAPPADGQGEQGEPIGGDGEKSADEIAAAVLSR